MVWSLPNSNACLVMSTKFQDFLQEKKIDPRRLLNASRLEERLRPEDRHLKLEQRRRSGSDGGNEGEENAQRPKPRSGRPVTPRLLHAASTGKPVSGPAKTRLLRAINRILQQRKQDPVDLRALF